MMIDLNSREAALLVWLGLFVVFAFAMKATRRSAVGVIKAFFAPKIVGIVIAAAVYTAVCVWLLADAGVWAARNLKTVLFWFAGTGFVAMMDIGALEKGTKTLRGVAKDAFAVSAVVVFLGGLETFPFWAEFLLIPFLACLSMMVVTAEYKPEHAILVRPISAVLSTAGLAILIHSLYRVYVDWQRFEGIHQAREFAVPILLTLMFLPFLYSLMLVVAYESAAIGLRYRVQDRGVRRYTWFRGVCAFGLHLELFNRFMQAIKLAGPTGRQQVRQIVEELKRSRQREKNPPEVDWALGWSPYEAGDFLVDAGLRATPYYRSFEERWCAESSTLDIGGGAFFDRLAYRIYGFETAATRLSLTLNVNSLEAPDQADTRFYDVAKELVSRALGDEPASRFAEATLQDESAIFEAGAFRLSLIRDDWGAGQRAGYSRRLTIAHPAHCDDEFVPE